MEQTVAPDGGVWAWLAVFGCFMGNVIGDGVMYSFGVFLPKFKEHFQCGSAEISIVSSVQMGVTFASGRFMHVRPCSHIPILLVGINT